MTIIRMGKNEGEISYPVLDLFERATGRGSLLHLGLRGITAISVIPPDNPEDIQVLVFNPVF